MTFEFQAFCKFCHNSKYFEVCSVDNCKIILPHMKPVYFQLCENLNPGMFLGSISYWIHVVSYPIAALSIFVTRDVITFCYSSWIKSVNPMFNTWVGLRWLHTVIKIDIAPISMSCYNQIWCCVSFDEWLVHTVLTASWLTWFACRHVHH